MVLKNPFTRKGTISLKEYGIRAVDECLGHDKGAQRTDQGDIGWLERRAEESDDAKLLMTTPGVGYFSALTILFR